MSRYVGQPLAGDAPSAEAKVRKAEDLVEKHAGPEVMEAAESQG